MAAPDGDGLPGTWVLEAFVFADSDGGLYHPLGETPAGVLTFTPDGYVTFSFMASDRAPFTSDDLFGGSDAERAAAARGYMTFGGPYRIDGDAIVIDVDYSLFPNWVGKRQTRRFELDGDRLTLRTTGALLFGGETRRGEARLRRAGHAP